MKPQKRTIFPRREVGLNFLSILSKIVAYGRSARDTVGQGVKSNKNWSFHFFAHPRASTALLPLSWGQNAQFSHPWIFFYAGGGVFLVLYLFCRRLQSWAEYKGIANSYPPKIKDEAAQRPKRTIFPWGEMGLNFPSILSKIVVYGRNAWDTLGQGVKSTKNWTFHFLTRPHASITLLTLGWGETETAATQSKRINASLNF